jgi:hypothetical protein
MSNNKSSYWNLPLANELEVHMNFNCRTGVKQTIDDFDSENININDVVCKFLKFTYMFLSLNNGPMLNFGLNTNGTQLSHSFRYPPEHAFTVRGSFLQETKN